MVRALLPVAIASGVSQGSVLGPVLFLAYISDITSNIRSQLRLFAYDCLVYHPINSSEDHEIFQDDLLKLLAWADIWQIKFSVKKCCIKRASTLQSRGIATIEATEAVT